MPEKVTLVVSVDAEEDQWGPSGGDQGLRNVRQLPTLSHFFERLGVHATYFATYKLTQEDWSVEILRDLDGQSTSEVAAHLHPWNTPPIEDLRHNRNSMTLNLPRETQSLKVASLTTSLSEALGRRPRVFRVGRWGLGPSTVRVLLEHGYEIDSSVAPYTDWRDHDDGPSFVGAPLSIFRLDGNGDVTRPAVGGPLVEVPVTWAYSRRPYALWHRVHSALSYRPLAPMRLMGVAARLGVLQKIALSPELDDADAMLHLSRQLIDAGMTFLHMFFHSSSLVAGNTPFAHSSADVRVLYDRMERFVDGLSSFATPVFATVTEAVELHK